MQAIETMQQFEGLIFIGKKEESQAEHSGPEYRHKVRQKSTPPQINRERRLALASKIS
jgi:hypothetical protein